MEDIPKCYIPLLLQNGLQGRTSGFADPFSGSEFWFSSEAFTMEFREHFSDMDESPESSREPCSYGTTFNSTSRVDSSHDASLRRSERAREGPETENDSESYGDGIQRRMVEGLSGAHNV